MGLWYEAVVKKTTKDLGFGFNEGSTVYFSINDADTVTVFNGRYAVRKLSMEQAKQCLRAKRDRHNKLVPAQNQEAVSSGYSAALYSY